MKAVVTENLSRLFGNFRAVDSVTFEVETGEIFGFLGANGAGKSTTIRMLCGILPPTSGSAYVMNKNVSDDPQGVKRAIGYMSQKFSLYGDLTVQENIEFAGGIRGLSASEMRKRRLEILESAGLKGSEKARTDSLPGGIKQRLALGCSLIHNPGLVFLDEPTAGVDPSSRRMFWDLILEMRELGRTVFVTSHYMDEVEQCDRVAMMDRGRIVALDSPSGLRKNVLPGPVLEIRCENLKGTRELLEGREEIARIDPFGRGFHAILSRKDSANKTAREFTSLLENRGAGRTEIVEVRPSLEDVFVFLIGGGRQ